MVGAGWRNSPKSIRQLLCRKISSVRNSILRRFGDLLFTHPFNDFFRTEWFAARGIEYQPTDFFAVEFPLSAIHERVKIARASADLLDFTNQLDERFVLALITLCHQSVWCCEKMLKENPSLFWYGFVDLASWQTHDSGRSLVRMC